MLANCRDIWERDYAHLAPHKWVKKRDVVKEWLYRGEGEDNVTANSAGILPAQSSAIQAMC